MSNEQENTKLYAVVIRTKNLDNLRAFYRDIFELGPPVVDSNYWTEFSLGGGINLVLELVDEENEGNSPPSNKNSIDWAIKVDDLDKEKERLLNAKVELQGEEMERFGKRVLIFRDPDGNLIHLIAKK